MAIAAGIVSDAFLAAVDALRDVTAEGGCSACFDSAHDAQLIQAQMAFMRPTIGTAITTENIPDFQGRAICCRSI